MKLGVFVSDFQVAVNTLERLKSDQLGIFLVQNGVYHAAVAENGKGSALLDAAPRVFALREDLETRGFAADAVDARVKVVGYGEVVDLIFNDYPKLAWL
ncbi:MAG TPA: sulfurtransferase complex subunit TusB [Candidatus Methanoperedens sp.]|nr:sulfurtransferase complex subunit TusB [Candidatus Methanoperedens sp.]